MAWKIEVENANGQKEAFTIIYDQRVKSPHGQGIAAILHSYTSDNKTVTEKRRWDNDDRSETPWNYLQSATQHLHPYHRIAGLPEPGINLTQRIADPIGMLRHDTVNDVTIRFINEHRDAKGLF